MPLTEESCAAVILSGGHSRRMGRTKALLPIGGEPMLARLFRQLNGFGERFISANDSALLGDIKARLVPDIYLETGPMGGLHAALDAARFPHLLVVPCDLPNFKKALALFMLSSFPPDAHALYCVDGAGHPHPLCGIYAKSALPALAAQLNSGNYRMRDLLKRLDAVALETTGHFPDTMFLNLNTPEAYTAFVEQRQKEEPNEPTSNSKAYPYYR